MKSKKKVIISYSPQAGEEGTITHRRIQKVMSRNALSKQDGCLGNVPPSVVRTNRLQMFPSHYKDDEEG